MLRAFSEGARFREADDAWRGLVRLERAKNVVALGKVESAQVLLKDFRDKSPAFQQARQLLESIETGRVATE